MSQGNLLPFEMPEIVLLFIDGPLSGITKKVKHNMISPTGLVRLVSKDNPFGLRQELNYTIVVGSQRDINQQRHIDCVVAK